ncbi:helix-turn-helix domain-containing protein [Rothia sp. P6271]|uniref:helix-turn-helix domain-containing protein n=1 Tax=Rothia sp. P6271 TaxID=3402659 RepID=UPI003ABF6F50
MTKLLTPAQVSELTGFKETTLANWRSQGKQLPYCKIGHSVRYRASDVEEWIRKNKPKKVYK